MNNHDIIDEIIQSEKQRILNYRLNSYWQEKLNSLIDDDEELENKLLNLKYEINVANDGRQINEINDICIHSIAFYICIFILLNMKNIQFRDQIKTMIYLLDYRFDKTLFNKNTRDTILNLDNWFNFTFNLKKSQVDLIFIKNKLLCFSKFLELYFMFLKKNDLFKVIKKTKSNNDLDTIIKVAIRGYDDFFVSGICKTQKEALQKASNEFTVNGKTVSYKQLRNNLNTAFNKGTITIDRTTKKIKYSKSIQEHRLE